MKKLIVILLCAISIPLMGQKRHAEYERYVRSVLVTFQPTDLGVGLMYRNLWERWGSYYSLSYGKYRMLDDKYIDDHFKAAAGIAFRSSDRVSCLTFGLTYHHYGERDLPYNFNYGALDPVSFEFGIGCNIQRFTAGFRFDPVKWEGCFDVGFNF